MRALKAAGMRTMTKRGLVARLICEVKNRACVHDFLFWKICIETRLRQQMLKQDENWSVVNIGIQYIMHSGIIVRYKCQMYVQLL